MNPIIYNIPVSMTAGYGNRRVIIRADDPELIIRVVEQEKPSNLEYIQLLSTKIDPKAMDNLAQWETDVPLDIIVNNPATEFPLLYNFSKIAANRPVRISIAVKPGFIKAVRLAAALRFSIKLLVKQPNVQLIRELFEVLDFYLHRTNVTEPIEYFHTLFLSLYHGEPVNLWTIQEEDPDLFRFVDDNGVETVSPRLAGANLEKIRGDLLVAGIAATQASVNECYACQFRESCGGYFKWTDQNYDCTGVKTIFGALSAAVAALKKDVAASTRRQGGTQ
jgi:hypothetical protein